MECMSKDTHAKKNLLIFIAYCHCVEQICFHHVVNRFNNNGKFMRKNSAIPVDFIQCFSWLLCKESNNGFFSVRQLDSKTDTKSKFEKTIGAIDVANEIHAHILTKQSYIFFIRKNFNKLSIHPPGFFRPFLILYTCFFLINYIKYYLFI